MFSTIIVAFDGEAGGLDASALGATLAYPYTDLVFAHIRLVRSEGRASDGSKSEDWPRAALELAAGACDVDRVRSVKAVIVDAQSVAVGLHALAEERSADLIVVGSHHRRRSGRLWSADRTRATLRDAECPVAVAPRGYAEMPQHPMTVIGTNFDGTDEARTALRFARGLADETGAQVHAIWVVNRSNWPDAESGMGRLALDATRRLANLDDVVGTVVEDDAGHADHALADFAREVDVLILGSHHHGLLGRLVIGDNARGLTPRLTCPLLVMDHRPPITPLPRSG